MVAKSISSVKTKGKSQVLLTLSMGSFITKTKERRGSEMYKMCDRPTHPWHQTQPHVTETTQYSPRATHASKITPQNFELDKSPGKQIILGPP